MNAETKAKQLGAKVEGFINWTWALWPPEDDGSRAKEFDKWCGEHGYETRGVDPPVISQSNPNINTWGVRFR